MFKLIAFRSAGLYGGLIGRKVGSPRRWREDGAYGGRDACRRRLQRESRVPRGDDTGEQKVQIRR
eukprot:2510833-Pleurochrysis_carterae.AAC.1